VSERKESQGKEPEQRIVLKIAEMDPRFKHQIREIPGAEKIMLCFQCGTCTADCPIARFSDDYRPRRILRMTQFGLRSKVLSSNVIWLCAACFTCVDHCPQDVEIASVLRALRNLAVKEGFLPAVYKDLASSILQTGLAYKIPDLRLKRREEMGLPLLPKADLESVNKLAEATGFSRAIQKEKT